MGGGRRESWGRLSGRAGEGGRRGELGTEGEWYENISKYLFFPNGKQLSQDHLLNSEFILH